MRFERRMAGGDDDASHLALSLLCTAPTPWGDLLSCQADPGTLLPAIAELGNNRGDWLWRIMFNQESGQTRFMRRNPMTASIAVSKQSLEPPCYDPVSALETLRLTIGRDQPELRLSGSAGVGNFILQASLDGKERIEVPAGAFDAYRLACQVSTFPAGKVDRGQNSYHLTLWLSRDERRLPLRAEAETVMGDIIVVATEVI